MKIYAITPELNKKQIKREIFQGKTPVVLNRNFKSFIKTNKQITDLYIFDASKEGLNNYQTVFPINNHINKTGKNPLIREKKEIKFYDITSIYKQQKQGKIAECYGNKKPSYPIKKNYKTAGFLCIYTIIAATNGIKNIYAYVVD